MRIGIFGAAQDAQCQAVMEAAGRQGLDTVVVESQGLNEGAPHSFDAQSFFYGDDPLHDVAGWYLRYIMAPLPPAFKDDEQHYLYADWFVSYMQRRERFSYQLAWLHWLEASGVPLLNPPEAGSVVQLKPYQLAAARSAGLDVPRTLVSNDPSAVLRFADAIGDVVYKPLLGGGLCHSLDDGARARIEGVVESPVIFQERVRGESVRVTLLNDRVLSQVVIPTDELDYRADPRYASGEVEYRDIQLPDELISKLYRLLDLCGLVFSGVDFIHTSDGRFVFLEANSSPVYLGIEHQTGAAISDGIVGYLLRAANEPGWFRAHGRKVRKSFVGYALPFEHDVTVGGD